MHFKKNFKVYFVVYNQETKKLPNPCGAPQRCIDVEFTSVRERKRFLSVRGLLFPCPPYLVDGGVLPESPSQRKCFFLFSICDGFRLKGARDPCSNDAGRPFAIPPRQLNSSDRYLQQIKGRQLRLNEMPLILLRNCVVATEL